jgi:hypothetical protein
MFNHFAKPEQNSDFGWYCDQAEQIKVNRKFAGNQSHHWLKADGRCAEISNTAELAFEN